MVFLWRVLFLKLFLHFHLINKCTAFSLAASPQQSNIFCKHYQLHLNKSNLTLLLTSHTNQRNQQRLITNKTKHEGLMSHQIQYRCFKFYLPCNVTPPMSTLNIISHKSYLLWPLISTATSLSMCLLQIIRLILPIWSPPIYHNLNGAWPYERSLKQSVMQSPCHYHGFVLR